MATEKRPDVEDTLDDLVRHLEMLQRGLDRCPETALAINKLKEARQFLSSTAPRRQRQDVDTSGTVRPWNPKAPPSRDQVPQGGGAVILIAPRREPATVAALAHRFAAVPGVTVVEDRRMGLDRRMVKGGRLFFSHRKGERRANLPPPPKGHFVGAIRWVKSVEV